MAVYGKIPIIVLFDGNYHKMLVPHDWPLAMVLSKLREKIQLRQNESLFMFSKDKSLYLGMSTEQAHLKYADEDKVLRVIIKRESVFG